ncbi:MAG: LLM class flavin-dependent oxidoreductase [Candidatus Tectomicrobia bacterium]|uniref:LLM class flavin-dependent oxidoreductase n=1 Tax=Tectimicrobiota bacterium TaxID=2528274 RepID=A0A937W1Y9_UNCTE|nr:LLM class flavin-dependent oxidoreductase [Candidatus Tectomicrobia bacterium]
MTLPARLKFGIFMAPFHQLGDDPTLAIDRDLELIQWLDYLGFDEAWIGEHHSAGWETIASPEVFIATAAERTKHINLGTGVVSLPYHHPLMVANRMILLDHLTKGRAMLGVGPGALGSDAYMLGIDPLTQRPRMDESLGIIMRLLTETEPLTYESDWFTLRDAVAHLRPYTHPHFPIVVAAAQSPAGMQLAGKHGAGVLSVSVIRDRGTAPDLRRFWSIAEETAAAHGHTMRREEWRMAVHVFLAESRKEAMEQARVGAGRYQREYFEQTLGLPAVLDGPSDRIIDELVDRGAWCVGTPDDLIAHIHRLDEESGGFGGLLIQATEWGTREQVLHSYELIARYVKPHFQGSLVNLRHSAAWSASKKETIMNLRTQAIEKAKRDYFVPASTV